MEVNMKRKRVIVYLIFSFLIITCKDTITEANSKELIGDLWVLESFEENGKTIIPLSSQTYNIQFFADSTLKGRSDCNEIFGYFELNTIYIQTDSLVTTKMGCGDKSLGDIYFNALHFAKSYVITGDQLTIYCENDANLIFRGE
jgi:heat shock protein HslJ